jgi:hypothetical protein
MFKSLSLALTISATLVFGSCSGGTQAPDTPAANADKPVTQKPPEGGKIEVASTPPGATIMLIATDEGGASPPLPRGSTPATLTGLAPGKYVIHLELHGYRFYQKEVEIKGDESVKVDAKLRKQ